MSAAFEDDHLPSAEDVMIPLNARSGSNINSSNDKKQPRTLMQPSLIPSQSAPMLRHISDTNAQSKSDQQPRRLSSEYLVGLVRKADDETTRRAVKPIQASCGKELEAFCASEVGLVRSAARIADGSLYSQVMLETLRNVHGCLAAKSDSLTPPCIDVLVKEFLASKSALVDPSPQTSLPLTSDQSHWRDRRRRMRHRRGHDDDDSSEHFTPTRGDATRGVGIFVINSANGELPPVVNNAIDQWGEHRYHRHHHDDHRTHPAVWMLVFPFFCVGVFVAAKFVYAYIKDRRGRLPCESGNEEYTPLKPPSSA